MMQYLNLSSISRKLMLGVSLLLPFTFGVSAQQGSIAVAIEKCSSEKSSLKRLMCFDRMAKSMRQYSGLEQSLTTAMPPIAASPIQPQPPAKLPVPAVAAAPQGAVESASAPSGEQVFGLEHKQDTDEMISKLYGYVTDVTKSIRGMSIITIDNGQVWRQNDGSALKVKVGETVYIERGVLGAFYLGKDDLNRRMKVKREQ